MTNFSLCSPAAIQTPTVFGAEILSLSATWVTNYTSYIPYSFNYNGDTVDLENAKFCNITVQYTHPGYKDTITVETWLPEPAKWNGRLQATGGGGWAAGRFVLPEFFMGGALGEGFATTTTDAGLGKDTTGPREWALTSPGNVDWVAVENFGSCAYNDQAIIGKELMNSFYGRAPEYSYWSGCSQGGRQGLMIAERYPTAYDGIAASAPAQSFTKFTSSLYYPLLMRIWHNVNPLVCELDFLASEAIAYCDPLDGVVDGLISNMGACNYDPFTAVNKTFICNPLNHTIALSQGAALIAHAAWSGARATDGRQLWYGYNPGSDIGSTFGAQPGYNGSVTTAVKDEWFNLFVARNFSFNTAGLSHEEYEEFFNLITSEYGSSWNADNADLHAFKNVGGKLITYHGMVRPFPFFYCPCCRNYRNYYEHNLHIARSPSRPIQVSPPRVLNTFTINPARSSQTFGTSGAFSNRRVWGTVPAASAASRPPSSRLSSAGSKMVLLQKPCPWNTRRLEMASTVICALILSRSNTLAAISLRLRASVAPKQWGRHDYCGCCGSSSHHRLTNSCILHLLNFTTVPYLL